MNDILQQVANTIQHTYHLEEYYIYETHLDRKVTERGETMYSVTFEWFPHSVTGREEDGSNPEGAAIVEVDLHTGRTKSLIFVQGKTYVDRPHVRGDDLASVIDWIERQSGLQYPFQFKITKEEDRHVIGKAYIHGEIVAPGASVEVKWNEDRIVTFFSVMGHFPQPTEVEEAPFQLSLEDLEDRLSNQLKFVELPIVHKKEIVPIFCIEEIYIGEDGESMMELERVGEGGGFIPLNLQLDYDHSEPIVWTKGDVMTSPEVTYEQFETREPHPDTAPITERDRELLIEVVKRYLKTEHPRESGRWILKHLKRDRGYFFAKVEGSKASIFGNQKIGLYIRPDTYELVTVMDNSWMESVIQDFNKVDSTTISHAEAFEQLRPYLTLTPRYVYEKDQDRYVYYYRLDCPFGIHASTGEVIRLSDLYK